ncbi:MAG: DEAD/DEAH box helicase, partial [Pseudomonadota bacterium]|nr:DEAD/DEAH box helicase [Pseudomonadota bacterium]
MSDFSLPSEFDLSDHFDHATLMRAIGLKPEQALLSQHEDSERLHTRLRGSGTEIYEQTISFFIDPRTGLHLRGLCTCPVGFNCMHVAAALMAHEAGLARARRLGVSEVGAGPAAEPVVASFASAGLPAAAQSGWSGRGGDARVTPPSTALPHALETWLGSLGERGGSVETRGSADRASAAAFTTGSATKRLMYVLCSAESRLLLKLHLASTRRNGDISRHHPHAPSVADMLRTRPSYVGVDDEALLAALLPFTLNRVDSLVPLRGRTAAATLQQLVRAGASWFVDSEDAVPETPPGPPLSWVDEPLSLRLRWRTDEHGHWLTRWEADRPSGEAATDREDLIDVDALVLLPEPHVFVRDASGRASVRPADVSGSGLTPATIRWLADMPAVPNHALPALVSRLRAMGLAHQVVLPLPDQHAQPLQELGELTLQPVLRLVTCPNVPSETWLEGHQRPPPAGQPLRQAAVQLLLRYELSAPGGARRSGAAVDFNFPAGASDVAFIEQPDPARPGQTQLMRFRRNALAEAQATQRLFEQLELRPWSRVAAFALDRMASLKAGRLQASALPPALDDGLLMLVPTARDRWPTLLSHHVPALQADGWRIERADDFPFEVYEADDFELSLDEAADGGTDWFRIGLKVSVGGTPVDLVPLLIGLVQAGWLKLEASLRDTDGEVLLPWPDDTAPAAASSGHARALPRERLLRLPVARVAPLVAWLRGVFSTTGFNAGEPRVSRFELGAIETLSAGLALRAPPALDRLLDQLRSLRVGEGLPAVAVSPNVQAQLRPYQLDGLAWMDFLRRAGFGGVLADDMGLGKTLQTLALLQAELDAGRLDRPSLVVVPTSLLENWQAEATRFTPQLRMLVLHGKQRAQQFKGIANAHVVVTSYPLAVRDMAMLASHTWHYLVLDEAQRIKNSRSQATLALKALNARHRLCLSGTPLENHLGELWSLMDFVSPGLLGNEAQFREHYRNPIEKRQETLQAEHLARRVRPFILRRTKLQVARDLPEKTETLLRVELEGAQRDLYETVRATMDGKLREAIAKQGLARSQIVVLDALLKLRQVCCDPRLLKLRAAPIEDDASMPPTGDADFGAAVAAKPAHRHSASVAPSAKLDLLRDLLPTLVEDGRRILVFSQFTEMLALIEIELTRLNLAYIKLTGDTANRGEVVRSFQEGDAPIFLISLKAGGVGLNLTAADTV